MAAVARQPALQGLGLPLVGMGCCAADTAVESDPSGRYARYPVLLGRGACKRVWKGFDELEGIEVAWNQVELLGMEEAARERLFAEIQVLKTLKHRNIMTFHDWWYHAPSATINFITEFFTSGTLRQYRKKHRHISEHAIKRWAFQILEGLMYLHAHSPPIVHRDLKCDNILINGTSGQVKIADLGLASCQRGLSVVGTPEFMAPEVYEESYDERIDIYSFGMCMLELATLEYPYSECRSIPAIFRKVSQGIPPAGLAKVPAGPLRDFITNCINPCPTQRPGALQLLKHEFFDSLLESPLGSPGHGPGKSCALSPPFGSCGNLHGLCSSSSHGSGVHSRALAGTSASRAASLNRRVYDSAGSADGVCGASSPSAAHPMRPEAAFADVGGSCSGGSCHTPCTAGVQQHGKAERLLGADDAGNDSGSTSSFVRGSTVCVAALGRLDAAPEDAEDSDDEVLVALEDVLTPHPGELLDECLASTATLSQAGHSTAAMVAAAAAAAAAADGRASCADVWPAGQPLDASACPSSPAAGGEALPDDVTDAGSTRGCSTCQLSFASQHYCDALRLASSPAFLFGGDACQHEVAALASCKSEAAASLASCAACPGPLLRCASTQRQAAAALAAAGLLLVSPGVYMSTPPLLEKLLARSSAAGRPPSAGAGSSAGGPDCHRSMRATADERLGHGQLCTLPADAAHAWGTTGTATQTADADCSARARGGGGGGSGYGRILVRRRFARHLPAAADLHRATTI